MKPATKRVFLLLVALAAAGLTAGCARKAKETPPTSPPVPPQTTPAPVPTPPTPTPPTPAPVPTPAPGSQAAAIALEPAFYDFDSYALRDDARAALDRNGRLLRDNPGVNITIEGHCDERGTVEYNQALGDRRAQAARDYLVAAGVDAGRIRTISYGKERPFAEGQDESGWAQNRRAHFVVRSS